MRKTQAVAHHIDQIGGIAAIEHAEARVEPQRPGVAPQQTIRNGVKCSRPWKPHILLYVAHDALSTADHFDCGSTREGEKQNAIGACAFEHEMRHAVREGVCFSGSGAGDDQKRAGGIAAAEARGLALALIQTIERMRTFHARNYSTFARLSLRGKRAAGSSTTHPCVIFTIPHEEARDLPAGTRRYQ